MRSLTHRWNISRGTIALIVIFAFGLALRMYLGATCDFKPDFSDMKDYNELATEGGFNAYLPPLYPLFLRAVYGLFGEFDYRAVFITQGVITSLMVLLMYGIAKRLSDETAALTAAAITAVYPNFIAYGLTTMTEALSLFAVVLLLWLIVTPFDHRKKAVAIAAVLAAGALMKSAMLFFVPGALIASRKRLLLLLVFAALIAPWIVRNALVVDTVAPVSNTGALNFYATYNPAATGSHHVDAEDTPLKTYDHDQMTYVREALKFIVHNKWQTVDITYNKLSILISRGWDTFVLGGVVGDRPTLINIMLYAYLPVVVLGFIGLVKLWDRRNGIIAITMLGYLVLAVLLAIFKVRYRVLIEPMLILYASFLVGHIRRSIASRKAGEIP